MLLGGFICVHPLSCRSPTFCFAIGRNPPATASSRCSAPRSRTQDDPQRALYAALRMQEDLRRYSAKLREGGNLAVEARVGVNTGEVVVRSIRTDDNHTEYARD